jgi:hypothetical protein
MLIALLMQLVYQNVLNYKDLKCFENLRTAFGRKRGFPTIGFLNSRDIFGIG